jgi:hypoxanthine phosphoribosyltransferase
MAVKYEFVDWDQCYQLCLNVYGKLAKTGIEPDVVVGMARGGWVPARILADLLVTGQTANVKVEFYRELYEAAESPRIVQPVSGETRWKRVLLVDDIADTGRSLKATVDHLKTQKVAELRTACLHVKPWTKFRPDFHAAVTRAWVVYPWELKEFVFAFANQLSGNRTPPEEVQRRLSELKPPMPLAGEFISQWRKAGKSRSTTTSQRTDSSARRVR